MNFKHLVTVSGLIIGYTLGSFAQAQVVATVGSKTITLEEFKKRYDEVKRNAYNPPPADLFLEDLVRYEVGVQEAEKQNLQNDPIVKERFRQELYKALVEKAIGNKVSNIKVTEAEMKRYYEKNPNLRTSHILIEFRADATPDQKEAARKRALEILADVKKSKREFGEMARLLSDDVVTKERGGDLDFQNRVTLVPPYYEAALGMKVGEIKGPVETRFGFHIIKLTGRQSYADVIDKRPIRTAVFDEKRKVLFDDYFKSLKSKYKIDVNKAALKGLK
jgi:peptidyl-prolyl cis-trans isomerase C/peptidyl-prolyl cis-trans isomerase D